MLKHGFRWTVLSVSLLLIMAAAGCAPKPAEPKQAAQTPSAGTTQQPAPSQKETKVKAYFADENLSKLVEKEVTVSYAAEADKYKASLEALKQAPDASVKSLFKAVTFRSADIQGGTVTVNLSISDEGRLGAPGEALFLDALKKSLFQFNEVQSIEILVDGKKTESLMGHMDLPHPIKR